MKRRIVKSSILCVLAFILFLTFNIGALAEEKEADLFQNDKVQSFAVTVTYEKEDAVVSLVSPSGTVYTTDMSSDTVAVFKDEKSTTIAIKDGEAGTWKIRYDKGTNEKLDYSISLISTQNFFIDSFSIGTVTDNGRLPYSFTVTGDEDTDFEYRLYAVTDNVSTDGTLLYTGRGHVGEEVTEERGVSLTALNTCDEYYICLYVSYNDGTFEYFDYEHSTAFSYTNPNVPEAFEHMATEVSPELYGGVFSWADQYLWNVQSVIVKQYEDDELVSENEFAAEDKQAGFVYGEDTKNLKLAFSYKQNNGLISEPYIKEIEIQPELKLTLPKDGLVNSTVWSFDYENGDDTELTVSINGEEEKITLDGNGSYRILLKEDYNKLEFTFMTDGDTSYHYERIANLNVIPPVITVYSDLDGMTTDRDSVIIQGMTDGEKLFINGEEAEIEEGGIFVYELELSDGENKITITAEAGDLSAVMNAVVTRTSSGIIVSESAGLEGYLPLFIVLLISLVGIILVLLLTGKRKEKKKRKKGRIWPVLSITGWIAAVALWIWFIARKIFENSADFISYANESLSRADSHLFWSAMVLVAAIVVTVMAVAFTVTAIILKVLKKRKNMTGMQQPRVNPPEPFNQ